MPSKRHDQHYAESYNQILSKFSRESMELGRQSVQVTVWLVGLSVGIIAVLISNIQSINFISPFFIKLVLILLLSVVIFGVGHRIIYHIAERIYWDHSVVLQSFLLGYTSAEEIPTDSLLEYWDRDEIVRRLKLEFDVDYNFLIERNVPIDECRQAYKKQYKIYKDSEEKSLASLAKVIAAYNGWSKEQEEKMFKVPIDEDFTKVRKKSKLMYKLFGIETILYYLAGVSFSLAILIITVGFMISHPDSSPNNVSGLVKPPVSQL